MNWLRRQRAPWGAEVWNKIDEAVVQQARHFMAARRVADFDGPHGWEFVAVRQGKTRASSVDNTSRQAVLSVPEVLLLTEIECSFQLPYAAVEVWERGGPVLDTSSAEAAARELAHAEDRLVFHGGPGSDGLLTSPASPRVSMGDWGNAASLISDVLSAVAKLDASGVPGPYTLLLDEAYYHAYFAAGASGYPAARHLSTSVASVVRSQVVRGGALFSTRGGDFVLTVGGDLAVGYAGHDDHGVRLFAIESLAAQLITPEAVCLLTVE